MGRSLRHKSKISLAKKRQSRKIKRDYKKKLSKRSKTKLMRKMRGRTKKRVTISNMSSEFEFPKYSLPIEIRNSMNVTKPTKQ